MSETRPPKSKYRWYQFRLRTPLLLMVAVAVGMPIYLDHADSYKLQHEAAAALAEERVSLTWEPVGPAWLKKLLSLRVDEEMLRDCVTVKAEHCGLSDEDLEHVRHMPRVEQLYLARNRITDEGLKQVAHLKRLKRLSLWGTNITPDGLRHLGPLRSLEVLDIQDAGSDHDYRLTADCLKHLAGVKSLKRIYFSFPIDDDGLAVLARFPNLKIRSLTLDGVTDAGLVSLPRLRALENVEVRPTTLRGEGLRHFGRMNKLRYLRLNHARISRDGWPRFADMKTLKVLSLGNTALDDDALRYIGRLKGLEKLWVPSTKVTDRGIAHVARLTNLRQLDLTGTSVTADCLEYLTAMKQLEVLRFHAPLDDDAVSCLAQLPNLQTLHGADWRTRYDLYLTDIGLIELSKLQCLSYLNLHDARDGRGKPGVDVPDGPDTMTDARLVQLWEADGLRHVSIFGRDVTLRGVRWRRKSGRRSPDVKLVSPRSAREVVNRSLGDRIMSAEIGDSFLNIQANADFGLDSVTVQFGERGVHLDLLRYIPAITRLTLRSLSAPVAPGYWDGLRFVSNLEEFETPEHIGWKQEAPMNAVGIRRLGEMKNLRKIICRMPDDMRPEDLAPLGRLKKLEEFDFWCRTYNGESMRFVGGLESLRKLRIFGKPSTVDGDCWLPSLAKLPQLEELWLYGLTDDAMPSIGRVKSLSRLSINGKGVTEEGLRCLDDLPALKYLDARGTGVTDQQRRDFKKRHPEVHVR